MRRFRNGAVTLVECLVVAAGVALLVALLLPALASARSRARLVSCSGSMHTLGRGLIGYATANADYLPMNVSPWTAADWRTRWVVGQPHVGWVGRVENYLTPSAPWLYALRCPEAVLVGGDVAVGEFVPSRPEAPGSS